MNRPKDRRVHAGCRNLGRSWSQAENRRICARMMAVEPFYWTAGVRETLDPGLLCIPGNGALTMDFRKLITFVSLAVCFSTVQAADKSVTRLSEPVAVTDNAEIFGAPLDESASPTSLQ